MLNVGNPAAGDTASGAINADCLTAKPDTIYTPGRHRDQPVELWHELIIARANRDVDDVLRRHGVADPSARAICSYIRVVRMGRFYEPHPSGELHVIVPVIDVDELVDLIAFDPSNPEIWRYRIGGERLLDGNALGDQLLGKPLQVFRTPLSWLQGRCAGIVLFDLGRAYIDLETAPNGIIGEDDVHTDEVRRAMTRRPWVVCHAFSPVRGTQHERRHQGRHEW